MVLDIRIDRLLKFLKKNEPTFKEQINSLLAVYSNYDIEDILIALLASNLWLLNISSPIKHQFFYAVLLSMNLEEFKKKRKIRNYNELKKLLQKLYKISPSFISTEDYMPEQDWGDIKFYHEKHSYRIFYGNELELVHEFLLEFQIIHNSLNGQYLSTINKSPIEEMSFCLSMQEKIIKMLPMKDLCDASDEIRPGHIELPSEKFWNQISAFTKSFNEDLISTFGETYLKEKSIQLGKFKKYEDESEFVELVFNGRLLPYYFIAYNGKYTPLLPRRYSSILIDEWAQLFYKNKDEIKKLLDVDFNLEWGSGVCQFVKGRCSKKYLFPLVSSQDKEGKPNELIFDVAMLVNDSLILIHQISDVKDLEKVNKLIESSKQQLKVKPTTLALHLERKSMELISKDNNVNLKLLTIVLLPDFDPAVFTTIPLGKDVDFTIGLRHFLAVFDECKNIDEFLDFLEHEQAGEIKTHPMINIMDKLGAYKDSKGVMHIGAKEPDMYFLDPHWGTDLRYRSLKKFWKVYPDRGFFDHPRTWDVRKETPTRTRLVARGFFGFALYTQLSGIDIFLNAPFHEMNYEQGDLSNFLIESLEDSLCAIKVNLTELKLFKSYKCLHVLVFPSSLVESDETFKHLKHLICKKEEIWNSDVKLLQSDIVGMRLVFNEKLVTKEFTKHDDNQAEVELLKYFFDSLNKFMQDKKFEDIKEIIDNKFKGKPPRYKLFYARVDVQFPQFVKFYHPSIKEFKEARKEISKLALNYGFQPGEYNADKGILMLNKLKMGLVKKVNSIVSEYDFKDSVLQLISMADSITNDFKREKISINNSLVLDVDFEREVKLSDVQMTFENDHKNHRYLIEKFIQLHPKGNKSLTNNVIKKLLAFIDEIHMLQSNSDAMNYAIFENKIKISDDFVCQIFSDEGYKENEKQFAEKHAKYNLGSIGNSDDKVGLSGELKDIIESINSALLSDLGFRLDNFFYVLDVLSGWASFSKQEVKGYYFASSEEIKKICLENIKDIDGDEVQRIIEYLIMDSTKILNILEQEEKCVDLPIWEVLKREYRYILKPLIEIGGTIHWGALSTLKVKEIWQARISLGTLPYTIEGTEIQKVIQKIKKLISKKLEKKAFEIMKRHTEYAEPGLFLEKRDNKYPQELGDYDVLAYHEGSNILFNIECKDILLPFCLKDSARMRNQIFGTEENKEAIGKIERRERYLLGNYASIFETLKWNIKPKRRPKVVSIYLSRSLNWWTEYPPYQTNVVFTRVDALEEIINDSIKNLK